MKKILYITTIDLTMNTFLIPHIESLIKSGNKVDCACNIQLELNEELVNMGVNHYQIDFSRNPLSLNNIKAIKQIKELQNKNKYDVVHVHTPVASFVTRFALKTENIKMIYTAHGFHFYKGAPKINWLVYYNLEKIAAKWTDAIITINEEDFKIAQLKFNSKRNKIFKINGIGVNLETFKEEKYNRSYKENLGLLDTDFVITVIAEFIERKNHRQIIESIELIEKKENIKVLFVGNGKLLNEMKLLVKQKKLESNFIFLGYRNDVNKIINISNVIALFSKQEGLPRNIMEAMSQGKPVLCTNIRGNNDLIKDEKNGILVELYDTKNTAKQIEALMNNNEKCLQFGTESKKLIKRYKLSSVLEEMKNIYFENDI